MTKPHFDGNPVAQAHLLFNIFSQINIIINEHDTLSIVFWAVLIISKNRKN